MDFTKIAQGLRLLADGLETETSPRSSRSQAKASPSDRPQSEEGEAASPEDAGDDQDLTVNLKDLQKAAKKLIQSDRRDDLKAVLEKYKLANLSSADEGDYGRIYKDLTAA